MNTVKKRKAFSTAKSERAPSLREVQSVLVDEFKRMGRVRPSRPLPFIKSDRFNRDFRFTVYKHGANEKFRADLRATFPYMLSFISQKRQVALLDTYAVENVPSHFSSVDSLKAFPTFVTDHFAKSNLGFLGEIAKIEWTIRAMSYSFHGFDAPVSRAYQVPPMTILEVEWQLINTHGELFHRGMGLSPKKGTQLVAIAATRDGIVTNALENDELKLLGSLSSAETKSQGGQNRKVQKTSRVTKDLELYRRLKTKGLIFKL